MSFECKYALNGHCELRGKECVPGDKGCVLIKAKARFIDFGKKDDAGKENKKEAGETNGGQ